MATGGAPTRKEEDFRHTCSLCMEPYRGRSPKILPCFHTFCLPCLTALQDSVTIATPERRPEQEKRPTEDEDQKQPDSNSDEGKKQDETSQGDDVTNDRSDDVEKSVFLCPTCRAPVSIPEGGVAALQTNFYLDHEAIADEAPPPVLCDMCDEVNRQHAAHACQQCQMRMCRDCRRYHDMIARDHHVTPVSHGQPVIKKSEKKSLCLVHQGRALCLHCRQCDVSICLLCKATSHEGHVTEDLASAALQAKREVTSLVTTAQQQLPVVETSLRRVDRDERELTRHKQEVTQQINARYDVLMTWATRSRDELLEEVSAKEDSARSQLRAEKTAATVTMETLSALVSRAARVTGKDPDVMWLRNELRAALLSEDRLDQHRQRADRQEPLWRWRYDVTEASVLQLEVVQAYMGRVVEGDRADVTRPLSLRELADKVDRLMNEMTETNTNVTAITARIAAITTDVTANTSNITANTNISSYRDEVTSLKKSEIDLQKKTASPVTDVADLQKQTTSLTTDTTTMKKTEADLKKMMSSLKADMTTLKKMEADLKKTMSSLEADMTTVKKTEADLEKTKSSLEKKMEKAGRTVVFCATSIDKTKTKFSKPIVFDNVKVNEGGCYDNTTGVFTTTVPGTYVFTATVGSEKKDSGVTAYIMVDGTAYTRLYGSFTSTGSSSVSVQLGLGQRVWVMSESDADKYSSYYQCFTGALVLPQLCHVDDDDNDHDDDHDDHHHECNFN